MTIVTSHDSAFQPIPVGLRASANAYADVSDKTFDWMVELAGKFVLPNGDAWLAERGTDKVHGYNAKFTNDLPDRTYARVGIIASGDEAREIVTGFGLTREFMDRDDFNPFHFLDMFYKSPDLRDAPRDLAETVAVWARRSHGKVPEGFLLCRRELEVYSDEEKGIVLLYRIHGDYAYVVPKARGRGLAGALSIAVAEQIDLDIRTIRNVVNALPTDQRPKLEGAVSGEPHSEGGEWVLGSLLESMEISFRLAGYPDAECEEDFSL